MRYYKGNQGKEYALAEKALARGGEGEIVEVIGETDFVAKLFHPDKRTEARYQKLMAMLMFPPAADTIGQVTWPQDLLYENEAFIGYIMPKLSGMVELNVMYSDKYKTNWRNYIKIAKNLCVAVNAVHEAGHVCGDLNPLNISVNPINGRVTLVDTDSYHITDRVTGKIYRCEVGLPDYIPKELQQKMVNGFTLQNAPLPTYSRESDYFALAVHIFAILMNGCHPFACAILPSEKSVVLPQLKENICKGIFPFLNHEAGTIIPVYAPPIEILPLKIKRLFHQAFILGNVTPEERPKAVEWHQALDELEYNLRACTVNPNHRFFKELVSCPWCELRNKMAGFLPSSLSINKMEQTSYSAPRILPIASGVSKQIVINKMKLFESDIKQVPDMKNRAYSYTFHKKTTRGIFFEISFTNYSKTPLKTTLNYKLYNRFGAIVFKTSNTFLLNPTFDTYWWGWEFIDNGNLSEGKYKIEVWFDHSNMVSSEFDVINPAPPLVSAPPFSGITRNTAKVSATSIPVAAASVPVAVNPNWNKNIAANASQTTKPASHYRKTKKKSFLRSFFFCIMLAAIAEALLVILYLISGSDWIPLQQLYIEIHNRFDRYPGAFLPVIVFYLPILFLTLLIKFTINLLSKLRYGFRRYVAIFIFLLLIYGSLNIYKTDIAEAYMELLGNYLGEDQLFTKEINSNTKTSQWALIECSSRDLAKAAESNPELACDGDASTSWHIQGEKDGVMEWIKLHNTTASTYYQLSITNGNVLTEDTYTDNNRVKKIGISFSDGSEMVAVLADHFMEPQIISFNQKVQSEYIKITILEIYPGEFYRNTYISEIAVLEKMH